MAKSFEVETLVDPVLVSKTVSSSTLGLKLPITIKNTSTKTLTGTYGVTAPNDRVSSGNDINATLSNVWNAELSTTYLSILANSLPQHTADFKSLATVLTGPKYGGYSNGEFSLTELLPGLYGIYLPLKQKSGYSGLIGSELSGYKDGTVETMDAAQILRVLWYNPNRDFMTNAAGQPANVRPPVSSYALGTGGYFIDVFGGNPHYDLRESTEYPGWYVYSGAVLKTSMSAYMPVIGYLFLLDINYAYSGFSNPYNRGFASDINAYRLKLAGAESLSGNYGPIPSITVTSSGVPWLNNLPSTTVAGGATVSANITINDAAKAALPTGLSGPYQLTFHETGNLTPDVYKNVNLNLHDGTTDYEIVKVGTPVKINRTDADCFYTRAKIKNTSTGPIASTSGDQTASFWKTGGTLKTTMLDNWGFAQQAAGVVNTGHTNSASYAFPITSEDSYQPKFYLYSAETALRDAMYSEQIGTFSSTGELLPTALASGWYGFNIVCNGTNTTSTVTNTIGIYDPNDSLVGLTYPVASVDNAGTTNIAPKIATSHSRNLSKTWDINLLTLKLWNKSTSPFNTMGAIIDLYEFKYRSGKTWVFQTGNLKDCFTVGIAIRGTPDPDLRFRFYNKPPFTYTVGPATTNVTVDSSAVSWLVDSTSPVVRPNEERGMLIPVESSGLPVGNSSTDMLTFTSQGSNIVKTAPVVLDVGGYTKPINCSAGANVDVSDFIPDRWYWRQGATTGTATTKIEIKDLSTGTISNIYGDAYAIGAHTKTVKPTTWQEMLDSWLVGATYDGANAINRGSILSGEIVPAVLSTVPNTAWCDHRGFIISLTAAVSSTSWPAGYVNNVYSSTEYAVGVTIYDPDDKLNINLGTFSNPSSGGVYNGAMFGYGFSTQPNPNAATPGSSVTSVGNVAHLVDGTSNERTWRVFTLTQGTSKYLVFGIHKDLVTANTRFRLYSQQPRIVTYGAAANKPVTVTLVNPSSWLDRTSAASFTLTGSGSARVDFAIDAPAAGGLAAGNYTEEVVIDVDGTQYNRSMAITVVPVSEKLTVDPVKGLDYYVTQNYIGSLDPAEDSEHTVYYESDGIPNNYSTLTAKFYNHEASFEECADARWSTFAGTFKKDSGTYDKGMLVATESSGKYTASFYAGYNENLTQDLTGYYLTTGRPATDAGTSMLYMKDKDGAVILPKAVVGADIEIVGESFENGTVYKINKIPGGTGVLNQFIFSGTVASGVVLSDYFVKLWNEKPAHLFYTAASAPALTVAKSDSWITLASSDFTVTP